MRLMILIGMKVKCINLEISSFDDEEDNRIDNLNKNIEWKEIHEQPDNNVIGMKRERIESDSEDDIDSELKDLLQDEDGDIILEEDKKEPKAITIQLKKNEIQIKKQENPKTVYRDRKTGKIIDPATESKEAKQKELERINYENVIIYLLSFLNGEKV
jgi:hypothetical protein